MKIAQIVAGLSPQSGGPSVSVPKLASALSRMGHSVSLLTTDHAGAAQKASEGLPPEVFKSVWPHALACSPGLKRRILTGDFTIIHHHGVWQRPLHYAHLGSRKIGCPLVLSPRGMLTPWSWNHHRFRKLLAQHFIHSGALAEVQGWHATSIEEAEQIKLLGFGQPICVAPNGVETPSTAAIENARLFWNERCPETTDRPVALFYSRFHRKKRVLELIDLWLSVAPKDWLLLLVGIPQEYSVEQLRDYVLRSSGQGRVAVFSGTDAPPPYAVASLFLLPSHTENFGMVVAEALIQGIPALVTDTTPWACINDTDFGWCGPWESFGNAMTASLALGPDVLKQRGKQAIPLVSAEYSWDKTAQKLSQFYEQLAKR